MNHRNLSLVATNLTESEFKAFCKGASLYFMSKALDEKDNKRRARFIKSEDFFDSAFDKYKHLCDK